MPRRRLVLTLADAEPGPATLFAARLLAWLGAEGRTRPMVVLGDGGAWRHRLEGHGPMVAGDALDEWWAARLRNRLPSRRGHRQLRWLRSAWWRLRLRRASALALSGPLPPGVAAVLPARLRRLAEQPAVPPVVPPDPAPAQPGPPPARAVVGIGPFDGSAGTDLWMRAVHELVRRGVPGPYVWYRTGPADERTAPVDHDLWHLGLDEVVELRRVGAGDATGDALATCAVLLLAGRSGGAPLGALDAVDGGRWAVGSPHGRAVGFDAVDAGAGDLPGGTTVPYPDVAALVTAAEQAVHDRDRGAEAALAGVLAASRPR